MSLKSLWQRVISGGGPRQSVSLDPVEQLTIRYLLEFGPRPAGDIHTEVNSTRLVTETDIEAAVGRLQAEGLIQSPGQAGAGAPGPLFSATKKASRLKGRIPREPGTVTEFYL